MICNQLRYYRNLLGFTQKEVADKINVSRQCYCHYENGSRTPSPDMIVKICVLFDIHADELLEIETEEQRAKIKKEMEQIK